MGEGLWDLKELIDLRVLLNLESWFVRVGLFKTKKQILPPITVIIPNIVDNKENMYPNCI